MNPYTGHLMTLPEGEELPTGYEWLPVALQDEAARQLNGKTETHVNLNGTGRLVDWAQKKRRAKMAAASKRRNRK